MKKTVSIIIPAHNEEKNIYRLLSSIILQKQRNYILNKITVSSDGSTDNTVHEAAKFDHSKVIVQDHSKRKGKVRRLNEAFVSNNSDILVQLDADVIFEHQYVLEQLIEPFIVSKEMCIVYGNQVPVLPNTYIGKLAYFGFYVWEEAKKQVNAERYNCFGQIMAFSKNFLKNYILPENKYITEDTYSFYFAKKNNYKTFFQKNASVLFKLPENFRDYMFQMNRYLTTRSDMERLFGKELVKQYETITKTKKYLALLNFSFRQPFYISLSYIFMQAITKIKAVSFKEKKLWYVVKTTKIF